MRISQVGDLRLWRVLYYLTGRWCYDVTIINGPRGPYSKPNVHRKTVLAVSASEATEIARINFGYLVQVPGYPDARTEVQVMAVKPWIRL